MKTPEKFNADAIRKTAETKIQENETISRIYPLIPDSVEGLNVFVCKTGYSADYLVKIEQDRPRYSLEPKQLTLSILRDLAAAFPPEPVAYYKGSTSTFLPVAVFEAFSQSKQDQYKEERNIASFVLKVEPSEHSQTVTLEWFSAVEGIGRVNVEVVMPLSAQPFVKSTVEYQRCGQFGRDRRVVRNDVGVNSDFQLIRDANGAGAEVAQMRYASGSQDTPGQHVIFWEPYNPQPVTLDALFASMEEASKEQEAAQ